MDFKKHIICDPFSSHREKLEKQTCYLLFMIRFCCTMEIYCFMPLAILVNMDNKHLKDSVFSHVNINFCVDNLSFRLPELWWSLMAIETDIAVFMVKNPIRWSLINLMGRTSPFGKTKWFSYFLLWNIICSISKSTTISRTQWWRFWQHRSW